MILNKERLQSRQNPTVLRVCSLQTKKGRDTENAFIADGEKLFYEAVAAKMPITQVFLSEENADRLLPVVTEKLSCDAYNETKVTLVSAEVFRKMTTEKAPQGILSVIKSLDFSGKKFIIDCSDFRIPDGESAIILSSLQDPGNLGTIIRSAVAFGVRNILLSADSVDPYNEKTVRAAMGSLFRVKIARFSDLSSAISVLRACGRRVFAAELRENAVPLSEIAVTPQDIFVIGNEGHGIDNSVSAVCNGSVFLPISAESESLNAAVAASILLWTQMYGK